MCNTINTISNNTLRCYTVTVGYENTAFYVKGYTKSISASSDRTPIILFITGQNGYYVTVYGVVRINGTVYFNENSSCTFNIDYDENKLTSFVSITFASKNLWASVGILLFDNRVTIQNYN